MARGKVQLCFNVDPDERELFDRLVEATHSGTRGDLFSEILKDLAAKHEKDLKPPPFFSEHTQK